MKQLKEEALQLFDTGDYRSFDEIYKGKEDLFEDVEDLNLIDNRKRKLFESIYGQNKPEKLQEDFRKGDTFGKSDHDFGSPTSFNDRYKKDIYTPTGKIRSPALARGNGPKGICLHAIDSVFCEVKKAMEKAYGWDISHDPATPSNSKVVELFRDVKKGRKTSEEAASIIMKPLTGKHPSGTAYDGSLHGDSWAEEVGDFQSEYLSYKPVMDEGFFRGVVNLIGNIIKTAVRFIVTIGPGGVAVARDIMKAMKQMRATAVNINGADADAFVGDATKVVAKLFDAAVKLDANADPNSLFESIYRMSENADYNFTGDEPGPSGDGVPASHNSSSTIGGSDPAVNQSEQDYSRNNKFFESVYKISEGSASDKLKAQSAAKQAKKGNKEDAARKKKSEEEDELSPAQKAKNKARRKQESFERIYEMTHDYNFTGDEPGPSGDGVPAGHNRAGLSGSDGQTVQSTPGSSNNAKIFDK